MPVLVVGADHPLGETIARRLAQPDREVRAFVSSTKIGAQLRTIGIKVAVGDLSDEGHIAAAASRCFAVVLVEAALTDGRDLAFATTSSARLGWARAVGAAGVARALWVGEDPPFIEVAEVGTVVTGARAHPDIADEVARLDDLAALEGFKVFGPAADRNRPNRL
jgi:putative NADH-flavin reductase